MAGIFGAYCAQGGSVLEEVYLGLYALQHRGQESAGIAWKDGERVSSKKGIGLLHNAIEQQNLVDISANSAIGHVRSKPVDGSRLQSVMPLCAKYARGIIATAHDGLVTNSKELVRQLEQRGAIFQSSASSEVILHLMAQKSHMLPLDAFVDALRRLEGATSIVVLLEDMLVAARDPWGFMPLALGKRGDTYYIASESCALDIIGAKLLRDVAPGEIIVIDDNGLRSLKNPTESNRRMRCAFEYVYTARPDSIIDGRSVYLARKELGRRAAAHLPCGADMVCGMPDSGTIAGIGYSEESKLPLEMGVVRNRYVGRTFIQPTQKVRELGVRIKLNPIPQIFRDKRTVIVDDSIVRGTTAERIVKMVRNSGAKEVHIRIASPPVTHQCKYGVDIGHGEVLAAVRMTHAELREKIGATSLEYITEEDLAASLGFPENEICMACFTGKYLEKTNGGSMNG